MYVLKIQTRNPKPVTRNPQLETRNPQPATRNPHPVTRTSINQLQPNTRLFCSRRTHFFYRISSRTAYWHSPQCENCRIYKRRKVRY